MIILECFSRKSYLFLLHSARHVVEYADERVRDALEFVDVLHELVAVILQIVGMTVDLLVGSADAVQLVEAEAIALEAAQSHLVLSSCFRD